MEQSYIFTVNGITRSTTEDKPLLRYLRDDLHLHSVKDGCSEGACGTCTIVIDGKAVTPSMFSYIHNMADSAPVLSQMARAKEYGTNIVRVVVTITGAEKDKIEPFVKPALDEILSQNPDAYILLAYGVSVNPFTTDGDYRSEAFKNQKGEMQSFRI